MRWMFGPWLTKFLMYVDRGWAKNWIVVGTCKRSDPGASIRFLTVRA